MTTDLEKLLAAAERVSRVWRLGEAKTKDNVRNAMNELDWTVALIKAQIGKDATRVIERKSLVSPNNGDT